jgi:p-aminobenzoyl-glutamate transporter AbgT
VAFLIVWMLLLVVFVVLGVPVGPGSPLYIPVPGAG